MSKKKIIITPYLDPQIVNDIYSSMGVKAPGKAAAATDGIDEDIHEEF